MTKEKFSPEQAFEILDFENKPFVAMTIVYVIREDEILLIKRSGDREMVPSKRMGLGGKVEPGESIVKSARRELREEAGIEAELELRGLLTWLSDANRVSQISIFVGFVSGDTDFVSDGREGELEWHKISEIFELPDLEKNQNQFLPTILEGKDFYAGMAVYSNHHQVMYTDNIRYLEGRRDTNL